MNKKVVLRLLIVLMISFIVGLNLKKYKQVPKNNLNVIAWNNFYEEKNINLYYGTTERQILNQLKYKYNVNNIVKNSNDEIEKSIKIMNWIKNNMECDKNKKNKIDEKGAADILSSKQKSKKYSDLEICTVFNEFCNCEDIMCRIGKFTASVETKIKDNDSFLVCEIWSPKYNKWVMIDVVNGAYLLENSIPLSSIDILQKGIYNLKVVIDKNDDKYKKDMEKYLYVYTIRIDNTVYSLRQSNCYITFIENNKNIDNVKNIFKYPAIYTKFRYLFDESPEKTKNKCNSNELPTMIFSKIQQNKKSNKTNENVKERLCIGVFKNSTMEEKISISINNSSFKQENKYCTMDLKKGVNNIKLSKDGKTAVREVIFEYKE